MRSRRSPPFGARTNSELISDDPDDDDIASDGRKSQANNRYWLERAVDATLLAKSMPTAKLKSEVAHIAAKFLKLAEKDAVPPRLLRKRQRR
jgi:hypothetical protein